MKLLINISEGDYNKIKSGHIADIFNNIANGRVITNNYDKIDELISSIEEYRINTEKLHYDNLEYAEAFNTAIDNVLDEISEWAKGV